MPSRITLHFHSEPPESSWLDINTSIVFPHSPNINLQPPPISVYGLIERFAFHRTRSYLSAIYTIDPFRAAPINYILAFRADYAISLNLTYNLAEVASDSTNWEKDVWIEHPNSGYFTAGNVYNTTNGAITFTIIDTPDPVLINILNTSFTEATNECTDVKVNIDTDVLATKVRVNNIIVLSGNTNNPFSFDWIRGAFINVEVENSDGNKSNKNIQLPESLSSSNTSIAILNSPSGATITTTVSNSSGLVLEYSLDNLNFQNSNIFSSILGNNIIYIRDQFSCLVQKSFNVPVFEDGGGVSQRVSYADLPSKSNSIRFARIVSFGVCGPYEIAENTLNCGFFQLFQNCDVITTQIKSSYENIDVTVIEENGIESIIPISKKTSNLNLKNKRDAIKYNIGGGKTGIYFTSGNLYDYYTNAITGSYSLNGSLPEWGVLYNFIFLESSWFEIESVLFDDSRNAEILVIDRVYLEVADESLIVSSAYDVEAYEVYEFVVYMGNYNDRKIQVNITQTDSDFDEDIVFLSSIIDIKERQESTVDILYYNNTNTDMFFITGIKNRIRVKLDYVSGDILDSTNTETTDSSAYLLNTHVYEIDVFHFSRTTKEMMNKIVQALSHKFVYIDGVQYVKKEAPSITPIIGVGRETQYTISAKMIKAQGVYRSQGVDKKFTTERKEFPKLLEITSGGYLKIKP